MAQQQGGIGDPLTLATSGVLMPFFGSPGDAALLEVASPVGDNSGLHMFFFDAACSRVGDSVGLPLTTNDIAFLQVGNVVPGLNAGLITIGSVDPSGFELRQLESPIHSRMYLFSPATGLSTIVEPIILDTAEFSSTEHWWSPLRTAVTYFAPQETAVVKTKVWFICPTPDIQGTTAAAPGVFSPFAPAGFPAIQPSFRGPTSALRARVYDANEVFLRDVTTTCTCVAAKSVLGVSNVYSDPLAVNGTYTEVEATPGATTDHAFTGYRSTAASPINNFFGRMSDGSRDSIQNTLKSLR